MKRPCNMYYYRLPKIKAWIDENTPGDLMIPFSVAFEYRVSSIYGISHTFKVYTHTGISIIVVSRVS
jgi:hypothetical protein